MADELGLKLTAQVDDWVKSLDKASKSADGLLKTVLELERAVKAAFAGIEAAARQGAGKAAGAFVSSAKAIDEATGRIETDAKNASKALGGIAVAADKTQKSVAESAGKIGKAAGDVGKGAAAAASSASSAVANVDASFSKVAGRLKDGIFSIQTALVGLGAVRFGQEAVGQASEFGQAIAYVGTVLGDTDIPLEKYRQQIIDLGGTTAQGAVERAKTLYQVLSSGIPATEGAAGAGAVLETSLKAATAGMANAEDAAKAITGTMNAYAETGLTATQASDVLFQTVNRGTVEFAELSRLFGQVSGVASSFGVSVEDIGAAIATITKAGLPAESAVSGVRQAIVSIARGPATKEAAKLLEELGIEFSTAALQSKGFSGVLQEIVDKTGGSAAALTTLFTDVDALKAVTKLAAGDMKVFKSDIEALSNSAGSTDKAFASLSQTFAFQADVAKNKLGTALIQIGDRILPTVAKTLGQLADYAEKNGGQIADGIGRAVEALASFGEWVVEYGPTVLKFFVAFKGVSFFWGLAKDIKSAVGELATFNQGFAASQALGQGFAALGAEAGGAFTGGFSSKLKGLGGTLKAAFSSPGVLGAAAAAGTIGYTIGEYLMNELGDAIEHGAQVQIKAAIDELDQQLTTRLRDLGARTVDEAAAIRRRLTSGEAVQTAPGRVQTLSEVQAQGGTAATTAAFNAGLAAIAAEVQKAQAGTAASVQRMQEAAAKIEDLQRSGRNAEEIGAAEAEFKQYQAVVAANGARVGALIKGSETLVAQYTEVTRTAAAVTQSAGAAGVKAAAGAKSAMQSAAKDTESDLERIAQEVIDLYKAEAAKLADLRAEQLRLTSEAATAEVEAKRAAFEAETQAREAALTDINASEEQLARYRRDRELELTKIVEDQAAAMRQAADVRIEEAKRAADEEAKAYAGSAEIQKQIAENLTRQIAIIDADATARTAELRISAANRVADAERDLANRTANTLQKQIQGALDQARAAFSDPGAFQPLQPGAEPAGPVAGALSGIGGIGGGAVGGAIAILPAINEVAGAGANFFGGDVAGLREQARAKDREAAQAEARIAAGGISDEEKAALQERADAARAEADAFRQGAEDAKGGLETFFEDLFANVQGFFVGVLQGLPQAIDRIANEGIPAFIEAVIGNLPKIITGFVTLTPRIVFAVAKGIAFALPKAIYQGFQDAGAQIIELLTSDIGQAITNAVATAFGVAVDVLRDGINAIFAPIIAFFSGALDAPGNILDSLDSFIEGIPIIGKGYKAVKGLIKDGAEAVDDGIESIPVVGKGYKGAKKFITSFLHQGGIVNAPSNPHAAALLAAAGAPRFAAGGMVTGVDSLARRRLSQVLSGDDIPALLSPGEGVLTARGVAAAGGPQAVESMNRGNEPGPSQAAQIVLSTRVGGDAALAALLTRVVSASMRSPSGSVRMAMDQVQRATRVPAFSGLT